MGAEIDGEVRQGDAVEERGGKAGEGEHGEGGKRRRGAGGEVRPREEERGAGAGRSGAG